MMENVLWQDLYAAAMLELDRDHLQRRIDAAQAAIQQARNEISEQGADCVEQIQALTDALRNLQTLQRVEFQNNHTSQPSGPEPARGVAL